MQTLIDLHKVAILRSAGTSEGVKKAWESRERKGSTPGELGEKAGRKENSQERERSENSVKEPWQMRKSEYEEKYGKPRKNTTVTGGFSQHRNAVATAINQGKITSHPDYPDLKPAVRFPTHHVGK